MKYEITIHINDILIFMKHCVCMYNNAVYKEIKLEKN